MGIEHINLGRTAVVAFLSCALGCGHVVQAPGTIATGSGVGKGDKSGPMAFDEPDEDFEEIDDVDDLEVVATGVDGLSVQRMSMAEAVDHRHPRGVGSRFQRGTEPLYLFLVITNLADEAQEVRVSFESDAGHGVRNIVLQVPARVNRWRTWAYPRSIRQEGLWTVIVSTGDGIELARERFQVEVTE